MDVIQDVIQELKNMQVDFETQLINKINNLIVEQFTSFKTEILDKINLLTNKVLELEKQCKSSVDMANNTPTMKSHPSTPSLTIKTKPSIRKPQTNLRLTMDKGTSCNSPATSAQDTTITVQEELSSSVPIPSVNSCEDLNKDGWVEVRPRRKRTSLPGVLRGTATPGSTLLQASERWRYLHLYYVQEGTTIQEVSKHLESICGNDMCTVEELKPRGRYASFKLGVPTKSAENVMSPENWAKDICIKPWRQNFRAKSQST